MTEAWLSGPVDGIDAYLQPAAHALVQAREDLPRIVADLTADQIWARPGGAASVGFHLLHAVGAVDRLFTYARGEGLSASQREALAAEKDEHRDQDPSALSAHVVAAIDLALGQLRATPRETLLTERKVGRAGLPSTTLGLLFHAAEHAMRHVGQAIATAKVVRGA